MKSSLSFVGVLCLVMPAMGQETKTEKTVVTTEKTVTTTKTETVKESGVDNLNELWSFSDAVPLSPGRFDLRLTGQWVTANAPANRGDSDDDFILIPSLYWGCCENVETFINVPVWVGDAGEIPGQEVGNADTYLGFLWRFAEQRDYWPAAAVGMSARIPTGDNSKGLDGELRLALTNEHDGGFRSHLNGFVVTVNGDLVENTRDFQWGAVVGFDGPLCGDGAVRWVLDYMNRSSYRYGSSNINLLDVGWEWAIADAHNLGMSLQVGLDDNEDTPNFGAKVTYAWSVTY